MIKRLVAPKKPLAMTMDIPKDRFSVALHVRTGGTRESVDHLYKHHVIKAPRPGFYIEQLHFLYTYLEKRPLFVFIFTDDANPLRLQQFFERACYGLDIQFRCRLEGNAHNKNVLEDFFAMTQFNASIHGDSNYSNCAGFLADYQIEIRAIDKRSDEQYGARMRVRHEDESIEYIDVPLEKFL